MKGIREIKSRIRGVKNTAQITRAMQLVAASKMKRAQDAAVKNRPYTALLAEILTSLVDHCENVEHPFFEARKEPRRGILVIGTDRGLCGALNQNLVRAVQKLAPTGAQFIATGKKITQAIKRLKLPLLAEFHASDPIQVPELRGIVEFLTQAYVDKKIDTVEVLFPRFKNTLLQEAIVERLLPLSNFREELENVFKRAGIDPEKHKADDRFFLLEPSPEALLQKLPEIFFEQTLYHQILEAKASEHSARMVAMKSATDNALGLIDDLTLEYNKARQASITQEILEIAASQKSAAA